MNRAKVSVTLDPDLLKTVDHYVAKSGLDRSKIVEQALELWSASQQNAAMEEQFRDDFAPEAERSGWRTIRRVAASERIEDWGA